MSNFFGQEESEEESPLYECKECGYEREFDKPGLTEGLVVARCRDCGESRLFRRAE